MMRQGEVAWCLGGAAWGGAVVCTDLSGGVLPGKCPAQAIARVGMLWYGREWYDAVGLEIVWFVWNSNGMIL